MLAIRIAVSAPDRADLRQTLFEEHKNYLRNTQLRILLSGPFAPSEGPSGGLVVADVADLDELQTFSDGDPFVVAGVYGQVTIAMWKPSFGPLLEALTRA